jgi:hypothetical protein
LTMHYHGTPITPITALYELAGRNFCVSSRAPADVARCHQIGQSVMLDNGAFSKWKSGKETNWDGFYAWCDKWLAYPTTWAIIPDVIDGGSQLQDAMIREWPHGDRGAPVWHMDEPLDRLAYSSPRSGRKSASDRPLNMPLSSRMGWERRMDEVFNEVSKRRHACHGFTCCAGCSASAAAGPLRPSIAPT